MKNFIRVCVVLIILICIVNCFIACENTSPNDNNDGTTAEAVEDNDLKLKINDNGVIDGKRIEIIVDNSSTSYSFIDTFSYSNNYKWELHADKACLPSLNIVSKNISLDEGDNFLFAMFVNKEDDSDIYLYEIVVHRKYEASILFYADNKLIYQDKATTKENYQIKYKYTPDTSRVTFNYWVDENGKKVDNTIFLNNTMKLYANTNEKATRVITTTDVKKFITTSSYIDYPSGSGPRVVCTVTLNLPKDAFPNNAVKIDSVSIKVRPVGTWAGENQSSTFKSGYINGKQTLTFAEEPPIVFTYSYVDLEHNQFAKKTIRMDLETSNAIWQLDSYNLNFEITGSISYEVVN